MAEFGKWSLYFAFAVSLYSLAASWLGIVKKRVEYLESARNSALMLFVLTSAATATLLYLLVTHDFRFEYVARYTSSTLPFAYTISALWGGQEGSLLFWLFLLSLFTLGVIVTAKDDAKPLMPYVIPVLTGTASFFLFILCFHTSPFETFPNGQAAIEGRDLNPLLQNPGMFVHPPSLYLGYVGVAAPFAFGLAALMSGRLDTEWMKLSRRWTLLAWLFLTIGNILGGKWAYVELGWGGYWAWDPVENAAFMPWLACTAFIHSVMIQEKRGMLKVWNVTLIILSFELAVFGTFLTRSGVISSVHSFGENTFGIYFLVFLVTSTVFSFGWVLYRLPMLRSENELESAVSRESGFLLNNIVLVGIAGVTCWGTLLPITSEVFKGQKMTAGPDFFNMMNVPMFLILLLLMGIGPLLAWRKTSSSMLLRNFFWPVCLGLGACVPLYLIGWRKPLALVSLGGSAFVLGTIAQEFWRGTVARRRMTGEAPGTAFVSLFRKNMRRYGGYVVHFGTLMIFVGVTASSAYKIEEEKTLKPGESMTAGRYRLTYEKLETETTAHRSVTRARIAVERNGKSVGYSLPEKHFYFKAEQPTTEVDIRSGLMEDLYVVLTAAQEDGQAIITAMVNPLVVWIWAGGGVVVFGTILCMLPGGERRKAAWRKTIQDRGRIEAEKETAGVGL